jgi:hypothetical protein
MRRLVVSVAALAMLATTALVAASPPAWGDAITRSNSCEQTWPTAAGPHTVYSGRVGITVPGFGPSCTAATDLGVGSQGGYVEVDQRIEIDATTGDIGLTATPRSQECGPWLHGCVSSAIGERLGCQASPGGGFDYCIATSRKVVYVPAHTFVTLSEACTWNGMPYAKATNVHIKCSVSLEYPVPAP